MARSYPPHDSISRGLLDSTICSNSASDPAGQEKEEDPRQEEEKAFFAQQPRGEGHMFIP